MDCQCSSLAICEWPIQCAITNLESGAPFVVSLFGSDRSSTKPCNLDFLLDFVVELKALMDTGIALSGRTARVKLEAFICDAPARAMVKGIIAFNGIFGCDFCDVQGHHENGRTMFLSEGTPRTDESFRRKENPKHHKQDSPLLMLDIDMVKQFPIDPMHSVDLGVMKRLLLIWKEGPRQTRLSNGQLTVVSNQLKAIAPFMPPVFNRKTRGLEEVKLWKATEFRTFLLYTGPIVLQGVLPPQMFSHFMCLSVAIKILHWKGNHLKDYHGYAKDLLRNFVVNAKFLYGEQLLTYNVHSLLHLADVAEHFDGLGQCSAYAFENHLGIIKRSVRGTSQVVRQIAHRLHERKSLPVQPKKPVHAQLRRGH